MRRITFRKTAPRAWLCPRGHVNFGTPNQDASGPGFPLICDRCNVSCVTGTDISDPSHIYRFRTSNYGQSDMGLVAKRA